MARREPKLEIVKTPDKSASILAPTVSPAFEGTESEDLLCGSCGVLLGKRISTDTLKARFAAPAQLLVKCPECGAHNRLPAQVGN